MKNHNNLIEIGSLRDITDIYDYYFEDMKIQRLGNKSALISLPEKRTLNMYDMDYWELEKLLVSIMLGTTETTGMSQQCKTLNQKLKPIIDLFYDKFGVTVHVDGESHVTISNMSNELLKESNLRHRDHILLYEFNRLIEKLISENNYNEAINNCIQAQDDTNLVGAANYNLGRIYFDQGRFDLAEEAFNKSVCVDYKRVEAMDGIAAIYYRQSKYEKAIEVYNLIQEEIGYDSKINQNIGVCYNHLKLYDKAIECFDRGMKYDNTNAYLYYYKGVSYYWLKQYDLTIKYWKKAMMLEPKNEIFMREYGKLVEFLKL